MHSSGAPTFQGRSEFDSGCEAGEGSIFLVEYHDDLVDEQGYGIIYIVNGTKVTPVLL